LSALLGLILYFLVAIGFSWTAWRLLAKFGPGGLAAYAALATVLLAGLGVARMAWTQAVLGVSRPGSLPATFAILTLMIGAAFVGAALALYRLSRGPDSAPRHPLRSGTIGFFLGAAVPLIYAFAQDVRRLMAP